MYLFLQRLRLFFVSAGTILLAVNAFVYSDLSHINREVSTLASEEPITVYVTGAVKQPGLYKLPAGSRLVDLISASGGFSEELDAKTFLSNVNLLQALNNYQKIALPANNSNNVSNTEKANGLINVNSATKKELQTLSGVGEVLSQRIIDARPIGSESDLANIAGLNASTLSKIRELVTY